MRYVDRVFATWTLALLGSFAAANLAGIVRPMELLPFRYTGFPFTFAVWGTGVEEAFDVGLLLLNVVIALTVSVFVAAAITHSRRKKITRESPRNGVAEPGAAPDRRGM